jgi:ribulose-phosphate 3-epimerase
MRIVPAILTEHFSSFETMVKSAASFTDWFQVDMMDGEFVPSKSISIEDVYRMKIPAGTTAEAHLMVKEPRGFYPVLKQSGYRKVIFHREAVRDPLRELHEIRVLGMEAGVALNPETDLSSISSLVPDLDTILFLSVQPGFYGSSFIPEVLETVKNARDRYSFLTLGIDGGVGFENLQEVRAAGVDYACVGSRIFNKPDPAEAYMRLCDALEPENE